MLDTLFSTKLIDISSVRPSISVSNLSSESITLLSNNFLEAGRNGIPILVTRANIDSINFIEGDLFDIVEGNLIYFACKRAQEQNGLFGSVSAIILDSKNEKIVKEQWRLLYGDTSNINMIKDEAIVTNSLPIVTKINNLEESLTNTINSLSTKINEQQKSINELLSANNSHISHLDQINTADAKMLTNLLNKDWGLSYSEAQKLAKLIIEEREANGLFTGFINVSERVYKQTKTGKRQRAMGRETLLKYIDHWICNG